MILDSWTSCFSHLGSEITDMGRHAWQVIHFTCTELEPNGWMCCPHTSGSAIKFEVQCRRFAGILSSRSHHLLASGPQSQLLADTEKADSQWVYFTESISLILRVKHPSDTQAASFSASWALLPGALIAFFLLLEGLCSQPFHTGDPDLLTSCKLCPRARHQNPALSRPCMLVHFSKPSIFDVLRIQERRNIWGHPQHYALFSLSF